MPKQTTNSLILNSPYATPSGYWKFVEEGESFGFENGRRTAIAICGEGNGRIAVKIVGDRGIESLRVVDVVSIGGK